MWIPGNAVSLRGRCLFGGWRLCFCWHTKTYKSVQDIVLKLQLTLYLKHAVSQTSLYLSTFSNFPSVFEIVYKIICIQKYLST